MSTNFMAREQMWRNLAWFGAGGAIVAWAWSSFARGGPAVFMLLVAVSAAVMVYLATQRTRVAWAGVLVAGVALLLGGLYLTTSLFFVGPSIVDWVLSSLLPMASAVALLLASGPGVLRARTTPSTQG